MATPNGMVALRETLTQDAFILNNILNQIWEMARALFRAYPQPVGFVLLSTSMPTARFEADKESGQEGSQSTDQRDVRPANKGVAFPASGAWFDRSNLLIRLKQQDESRAFAEDLDAIGELIRNWRMDHQYPRARLAHDIGMPVDALLFLETGNGIPEDISKTQLLLLLRRLADDELGEEFTLRARSYLKKLDAALPGKARAQSTEHRSSLGSSEVALSQENLP